MVYHLKIKQITKRNRPSIPPQITHTPTAGARPAPLPYYPTPAITTTTQRPRDLSLKLDQQHSNLRVGESTEVECYSSDNSYTEVIWERADGRPLPLNIQVN